MLARPGKSGRRESPRIRAISKQPGSSPGRSDWLGGHGPLDERKQILEGGIAAARVAIAAEPKRPEGHFWLAATMGELAESFGLRQGIKYRGEIKDALLTVLKLDPAFQQGSADRALGRWYVQSARALRR